MGWFIATGVTQLSSKVEENKKNNKKGWHQQKVETHQYKYKISSFKLQEMLQVDLELQCLHLLRNH